MSLLQQQAAARSTARQSKRKEEKKVSSPPPPIDPDPEGVIKKTPSGTLYRVTTVALMALPGYLERKKLEPKLYYYYPPESDWVLGVRPKEEENKET